MVVEPISEPPESEKDTHTDEMRGKRRNLLLRILTYKRDLGLFDPTPTIGGQIKRIPSRDFTRSNLWKKVGSSQFGQTYLSTCQKSPSIRGSQSHVCPTVDIFCTSHDFRTYPIEPPSDVHYIGDSKKLLGEVLQRVHQSQTPNNTSRLGTKDTRVRGKVTRIDGCLINRHKQGSHKTHPTL